MTKMCSEAKRLKTNHHTPMSWRLRPVLSDDLYADVPLVNVWVDKINNKKHISSIISHLNKLCPIPNLQHLKRVRGEEILIASEDTQIGDLVEKLSPIEACTLGLTLKPYLTQVPAAPPKTKAQFTFCNRLWPCNFHPDKILEDKLSGAEFSEADLGRIESWMRICLDLSSESPACVVVDVRTNQLIASGVSERRSHPMKHAAMVAIDNVAKSQCGGVWNKIPLEMANNQSNSPKTEERKIPKVLDNEPNAKSSLLSDECRNRNQLDKTSNLEPPIERALFLAGSSDGIFDEPDDRLEGPYLCTGYDVYLTVEPCLMCAMALVHSRAKRIFYGCPNLKSGALGSRLKLHTVGNLNHHYEVYSGVLRKECEELCARMKYEA